MKVSGLALVVLLCACGDDGGADSADAAPPDAEVANCPDVSGLWSFSYSCTLEMGEDAGGFGAEVLQTGCEVTLTQEDDNTPTVWISTGTVDEPGSLTLLGDFGFTGATSCTGAVSGTAWDLFCADTEPCELTAEKFASAPAR